LAVPILASKGWTNGSNRAVACLFGRVADAFCEHGHATHVYTKLT